ncbi:MAG: hypothetical protein ACOH10_07815 [Rhodoglobus sp.]
MNFTTQEYKGFTLIKVSSGPGNIVWEVVKWNGEILEGCSSLAYAKKFAREYLAREQEEN